MTLFTDNDSSLESGLGSVLIEIVDAILIFFFPPRLPGRIEGWQNPDPVLPNWIRRRQYIPTPINAHRIPASIQWK